MRGYAADLRNVLGSGSIMEQKGFLKLFIKSIAVSNSHMTLNYTLPMPPSNTDKETVGVLDFAGSGRPYRSKSRTFIASFALSF